MLSDTVCRFDLAEWSSHTEVQIAAQLGGLEVAGLKADDLVLVAVKSPPPRALDTDTDVTGEVALAVEARDVADRVEVSMSLTVKPSLLHSSTASWASLGRPPKYSSTPIGWHCSQL